MMSSNIASGVIIGLIPIIQIGVIYRLLWVPGQSEVDRKTCDCSCFDAVFKGSYEMKDVKHGYKHVYFNATWQTMCVWIVTLAYILLGYEALKSFTSLLLSRSLRLTMGIVFCISIYPHVYAWFAFFNYYNDDFYSMFRHQVYFAVTEIVSSYAILKSCDRHVMRQRHLYSIIVGTAMVHLLIGSMDQFIVNLFLNKGRFHQVWRDIFLAFPDLLNIIVPVFEYVKSNKAEMKTSNRHNGYALLLTNCITVRMPRHMKYVITYIGLILILGLAI